MEHSFRAVVFILLFIAVVRGAEPTPRVVASLSGMDLLAQDLSPNVARVRKQLERSLGRAPEADELAQGLIIEQTEKLFAWMRQAVIREGADECGIVISEQDQRATLAEIYKDDDAVLDRLAKMRERFPRSWREARAHPERADEIYETRLKELMSRDRWQKYLEEETTAETVRRLEKTAPPRKEDLYRPNDALKQILTERALRRRIAVGIDVTEDEILAEYRGTGCDRPFEVVRDVIAATLVAAKEERAWQQWLGKRMKQAATSICDVELRKQYQAYLQNALQQDKGTDQTPAPTDGQ